MHVKSPCCPLALWVHYNRRFSFSQCDTHVQTTPFLSVHIPHSASTRAACLQTELFLSIHSPFRLHGTAADLQIERVDGSWLSSKEQICVTHAGIRLQACGDGGYWLGIVFSPIWKFASLIGLEIYYLCTSFHAKITCCWKLQWLIGEHNQRLGCHGIGCGHGTEHDADGEARAAKTGPLVAAGRCML